MANNIDLEIIRYSYTSMGDHELMVFAEEESMKLSPEAYRLLKAELERRSIGSSVIDRMDRRILVDHALRQKKFIEDFHRDLFQAAIEYALIAKKQELSQYDIYAGLIERGVPEGYANQMINKLDQWASSLHKQARTDLHSGAAILIIGIGLFLTVQINHFDIIALMVIVIGIVKIFSSATAHKKYRAIIDSLENENE